MARLDIVVLPKGLFYMRAILAYQTYTTFQALIPCSPPCHRCTLTTDAIECVSSNWKFLPDSWTVDGSRIEIPAKGYMLTMDYANLSARNLSETNVGIKLVDFKFSSIVELLLELILTTEGE